MTVTTAQGLKSDFCDLEQNKVFFFIQIYFIPTAFLLVLVFGLTLNCLCLYVMVRQTKPWNRSTLFLSNLTVADTMWILTLPFLIHYHFTRLQWAFGDVACKIVRFTYHVCFYSSIYFVTCISLDRYLAIVHPVQSLFLLSRRQSLYVCVAIWVLTSMVSIPSTFMAFTFPCSRNQSVCTFYAFSYDTNKALPYSVVSTVTGFLLPFVAICYCYWNSTKELKKHNLHCTQKKKKLFRLMYSVLVIFGLMYLPYHLMRNTCILLRAFWRNQTQLIDNSDTSYSVEMVICSFHTCINPFFYFITSSNTKNSVRKTLSSCCRETRRQVRLQVAAVHPV